MEHSLDFNFKVEPLLELGESIDIEYGNLDTDVENFFINTEPKNEIFITEVQTDMQEIISHEITEPESPIPEYNSESSECFPCSEEDSENKQYIWVDGHLKVCNKVNISKEVSLLKKSFVLFPTFSEISSLNNSSSNIVYWMEGNISEVKSYCVIPPEIVQKFYEYNEGKRKNLLQKIIKQDTKAKLYLSWDAVNSRVEDLADQSRTKYIVAYKQHSFQTINKPVLARGLYFELLPFQKIVDITVPYTGVPLMHIGRCTMTCHLAKRKFKLKTQKGNGVKQSKKIGCPATIEIMKIMRFPDFDVSCLKQEARKAVIAELLEALAVEAECVRYYIEYYVKEPLLSDHQGHDKLLTDKEPPDPRFQNKIDELLKEGVNPSVINLNYVKDFLKDQIGNSSPKRRKYNPSSRDIRYMKEKGQKKLEQEKNSVMKSDCEELMSQITLLSDSTNWSTIRDQLQTMRDSILFDRTNNIILEDGVNLVLDNDVGDIQLSDPVQGLLSSHIPNNSIYNDCTKSWNPINFVSCNDRPTTEAAVFEAFVSEDFCNVASLQ